MPAADTTPSTCSSQGQEIPMWSSPASRAGSSLASISPGRQQNTACVNCIGSLGEMEAAVCEGHDNCPPHLLTPELSLFPLPPIPILGTRPSLRRNWSQNSAVVSASSTKCQSPINGDLALTGCNHNIILPPELSHSAKAGSM